MEERRRRRKKKMEKSYAKIGKFTKSIFREIFGISRSGKRLFVGEGEIFAYTKFQNFTPISGLRT